MRSSSNTFPKSTKYKVTISYVIDGVTHEISKDKISNLDKAADFIKEQVSLIQKDADMDISILTA